MLKLALGMGSIVMMIATILVAFVLMKMWFSAAHYFLLK
jgi:hypothetical protein